MAKTTKNELVKVDTDSGSRSFNRFEFQLSQSLHMAIDLYDQINYLLILDHYDDITVFDLDSEPLAVSYYQVKTSDGTITIDSAIKDGWISKLYAQMQRPENWLVKELGLITNVPLTVNFTAHSKKRKVDASGSDRYDAPKTSFTKFSKPVQDKLKDDIAEHCGVSRDSVDLSKFAHLHTTLSIDRHKDLTEKEMSDFLYEKYPLIKIDTVKAIYSTVIALLTRQQSNERMPDDATLDDVRKYKGFSKEDFKRVINKSILMSMPSFDDVKRIIGTASDPAKISLPYVTILADSNNRGNETFSNLFNETVKLIDQKPFVNYKTAWDYAQELDGELRKQQPILCVSFSENYIAVLVICIIINLTRKNMDPVKALSSGE